MIHVILCAKPGISSVDQAQSVLNCWKKKGFVGTTYVIDEKHDRATMKAVFELLPLLRGPVLLFNTATTIFIEGRFEQWVARWVAATAPIWCTGTSGGSPIWGAVSAQSRMLYNALENASEPDKDSMGKFLQSLSELYCDSTPLTFTYTLPFFPIRRPRCIAPTRRQEILMTSLIQPPPHVERFKTLVYDNGFMVALGCSGGVCVIILIVLVAHLNNLPSHV